MIWLLKVKVFGELGRLQLQVADYLKVTERTIYRLAEAKQIPAFKVGGSWRFSKADIDGWIKRQSMEAAKEPSSKATEE
jgi:excisionase family DNA binding protein